MSAEFTCPFCDAVFEEEAALLAHFCPNAPTDSDSNA